MRRVLFAVCLLCATSAIGDVPASGVIIDPDNGLAIDADSGLVVAPGWQDVRGHCGACHDYTLVTAQRGNRLFWTRLIRWMQETQNLWQFDPATEDRILEYLSTSYTAEFGGRRRPIEASLMPQ